MSALKKPAMLLAAGLALIGAVVGTAYALHVGPWKPKDLGPVIARVDGRPIYLSEAEARLHGLSSVHGDIQKKLGKDWHDKVLQSLVDDVIIQEEADRRAIHLTDEEISAGLAQIRRGFPSEDAFRRWLDSQGMDVAELERRMTLNMLAARVYLAVTAGVKVSSDEVRAYYRSHRADYETEGGVRPLLEVRATIRQDLTKRKRDRAFAAWLDDRRRAAKVVVVLDDWWRSIR